MKALGKHAFYDCGRLCGVVFEPGARLRSIGDYCFGHCGLEEMTLPKSVRTIGDCAFHSCERLRALRFEAGSQLRRVGRSAFFCTGLRQEDVRYPESLPPEGHGAEW